MRHSVNIFWGKSAGECLLALHKYMLRSGEEQVNNFFRSYLYVEEDSDAHFERVIQGEDGDLMLETEKQFALSAIGVELPKFVQDTHRQMITIHNRGDYANLYLCIYVPLLEDVKHVMSFISSIENGGFNYVDIDVICLAGDLCEAISVSYDNGKTLLQLQQETGKGLRLLSDYKKKHSQPHHLLVIQDYQNGGANLSLHLASLTRVLGELSLMMIEDYASVFGNVQPMSDVQTMGLSMLQLDRYYFLEYMLRKTIREIAQRERIEIDKVDINMATKSADDLLRPWITLLQDTYRSEVKQALDMHQTETEIVSRIDDYLAEQFAKMKEDLESYITDEKLSLPEKKAILSAILGQDDILFVNDLYDEELLSFNDLEREPIEQFISTNNYILTHADYALDAILSEGGEAAVYPIDEMRANRIKLRRTIAYIRELNEEQKRLEQQMDMQEHANDCFIGDGGFSIGERTYKLLPQVDDIPLKEQYQPHPTHVASLDLSAQMPRVKDQGGQGACLAFSLTSICEYMYKQMTQQEIDLSEQFLYYIAREKAGKTDLDEGSSLTFAVESLAEKGLCTEDKWIYGKAETAYNIRPSEEAYIDALDRKVAQAMNVAVELDAIRSALSDGHPVVISAKLYDSFGEARTGYVPMPSEEERQSANPEVNRNHAMVIVGYNDEIRAFKVRNSWGEQFGLGGYIYMPYAYITDGSLINYAAILTELRLAQTLTEKYVIAHNEKIRIDIPRLEFDRSDTQTQYGINKILLDDAQASLRILTRIDYDLSRYCLNLKQKLKNPNLRQQLRKTADECYTIDIANKKKELDLALNSKNDELNILERKSRRSFVTYGVIVLLLTAFFITTGVVRHYSSKRADVYTELIKKVTKKEPFNPNASVIDPFSKKGETISVAQMKILKEVYTGVSITMSKCHQWWIVLVAYLVLGVWVLVLIIQYRKARRAIEELYAEQIDRLSNEKGALQRVLNELGIKFFLAGTMLTQFFTIHDQLETKAKILESFLLNTRALVEENEKMLQNMSPDVQPPFIPMLNNDQLDKFFALTVDSLVSGSRLYRFFEGYNISNEAFAEFLIALRKKVGENIAEILKDFSMYKYMSGLERYAYLSTEKRQVVDFLIELDDKSTVFMLCNDNEAINPAKALYLHIEENEEPSWSSTYPRAFSIKPSCVNIQSRFKIILLQLLDLNLSQIEWYKTSN